MSDEFRLITLKLYNITCLLSIYSLLNAGYILFTSTKEVDFKITGANRAAVQHDFGL